MIVRETAIAAMISNMRRMLGLCFLAVLWASSASAALPSAKSSVDKMAAALKKHPSLEIVFTVWNNGNSSSGSMSVAGRNFSLSTPEMKVWYDGKTQWTYLHSAGEVNVTQPTPAELAQTNPLSILGPLSKNFTLRRLKAPAGEERIEFIPVKKSPDLVSATVTINVSTHLPKEIAVRNAAGSQTVIKISSLKGGKTRPATAFRFSPAAYPGVEVVDLR